MGKKSNISKLAFTQTQVILAVGHTSTPVCAQKVGDDNTQPIGSRQLVRQAQEEEEEDQGS